MAVNDEKAGKIAQLLMVIGTGAAECAKEDPENAEGWRRIIEYLRKAAELLYKIQTNRKSNYPGRDDTDNNYKVGAAI